MKPRDPSSWTPFQKLSSRAGRYKRTPDSYSVGERKVRDILDGMEVVYEHNKQVRCYNTRYWLDFWVPSKSLSIEVSPLIWHSKYFKADEARHRRDMRLLTKGIQTVHLSDSILKDTERLARRLRSILL